MLASNLVTIYKGQYNKVAPAIIKAGQSIASPAWVMDNRNQLGKKPDYLQDVMLYTNCGIFTYKKNIYVRPNSKNLIRITPKKELTNHGILTYDFSGAKAYSTSDIMLNRPLTENEAREHIILLELAEGSQERLDKYVENAFRQAKNSGHKEGVMGVYIEKESQPIERPVAFARPIFGADICSGNLDADKAFLIGLGKVSDTLKAIDESELANISPKNLENIILVK